VSPPPVVADPNDLLGTYSFLPWLRQGIANAITAALISVRWLALVDVLTRYRLLNSMRDVISPLTNPNSATPSERALDIAA